MKIGGGLGQNAKMTLLPTWALMSIKTHMRIYACMDLRRGIGYYVSNDKICKILIIQQTPS